MSKTEDLKMFGQRVRRARIDAGMTLQELADRCEYGSRSTVGKLEKGLIDVSTTKAQIIADALGVNVLDLLGFSADLAIVDSDIAFIIEVAKTDPDSRARLLAYAKKLKELKEMEEE